MGLCHNGFNVMHEFDIMMCATLSRLNLFIYLVSILDIMSLACVQAAWEAVLMWAWKIVETAFFDLCVCDC